MLGPYLDRLHQLGTSYNLLVWWRLFPRYRFLRGMVLLLSFLEDNTHLESIERDSAFEIRLDRRTRPSINLRLQIHPK